jgi:hypothetical protein
MIRPNSFLAAFLLAALCMALAACSPRFNWREVRPDNTALSLLLPCKPDHVQRQVPLGGVPTELAMLGCEVEGSTFAIAVATVPQAGQVGPVLAGWQAAALARLQASRSEATPVSIPGAALYPPALRVLASGQDAGGHGVQSQAVYFSQGQQVFQAVIIARQISPEIADTFFANLKLAR